VLDLDSRRRVAERDKPDLDLGRVRAIASEVPQIAQPPGRLPDGDLAPVVLVAGRGSLEDPAALPWLQDDQQIGRSAHGV